MSRTCSRCCASPPIRAASAPPGGRCSSCRASARPRAGRLIARWPRPPTRRRRCAAFVPRRRRRRRPGRSSPRCSRPCARRPSPWPDDIAAVERWYRPQLERLHDDAAPRAADVAHLVRLAAGYVSRERFLTELALDPPAATQRRVRARLARRGLPDPVDDPFGQGTGVERGLGAQRRRRLHPVGHGDRQRRRDRGGAAAALRRDDARPASPAPARAAALLRDAAVGATATATCTRRSAASCREAIRDRFVHLGPAGGRRRPRTPRRRRCAPVDIAARVRAALALKRCARRKEKAAASNGPMLPLDGPPSFRRSARPLRRRHDLVDGVLDLFLGVAVVLLHLAGGLVDRAFGLEVRGCRRPCRWFP